MSPRDLSSATVHERLRLMTELLEDLDELGPVSEARLRAERLHRRALERILTQLVDQAADINQHVSSTAGGQVASDYRSSFDLAAETGAISPDLARQLKPSVGLRNVLVHEYVNVDLAIVANATPYSGCRLGLDMRIELGPDGRFVEVDVKSSALIH